MFRVNKYGMALQKWRGLSRILRVIIGKEHGGETIYARISFSEISWFVAADY